MIEIRHRNERGHFDHGLQIGRGSLELNGTKLEAGDGAAVSDTQVLQISGNGEALLFDLN